MRQRAVAVPGAPETGAAFEIEDAVDLARQVCEGVGYAHKRGIVHCDLKPQNVLVTPDGHAKVTDFGIARAYTLAVDPNLREETVWGTPQYFAPEQAAGAAPTPASDVYSIGVMLYELLAGRLPFESSDPVALARMHQNQEPPALSARNPAVSSQLEGIVRRALAKDPAQRFRNADQLGATISAWLRQGDERTLMGMNPVAPPAADPRTAPPRPAARASDPSVQERINTRTGVNPVKPAPARAASKPAPAGSGQYTVNGATSARSEGTDVLLLLLGAIALVCVLGLIPLYAKVYAEYTAPPAPADQRQPQLAPAAVAAAPRAGAQAQQTGRSRPRRRA